ncbi:class I adenylate-forming enzyme family protein [Streptomyces sp. NBC_00893]|uniref:class I adenylate-forming enzyme family protein n=1 Tax=Streptomyces sp. NBC_00893 TaxID=2975862 RepID=UPI002258759F|nr:class I adenylate-forming enzyme family protein [Streptomyces sp. NBC_00893]MCX4850444.1 acyl--CoA ligase [Streptomyces sp. NBC_00893]
MLLFRATHDAEHLAIRDWAGGSLTFGEWAERSAGFRDALRDNGVRPGEHVGLVFDRRDWITFAVSYFGTMRSGAIPVSIENHPERIESRARHTDVSLCIVGEHAHRPDMPWVDATDLMTSTGAPDSDAELSPDSVMDIVFTSGTVNGAYKAVRCRHADWLGARRLVPVRRQQTCVHSLFQPHSSAGVHGLLITHLERGVLSVAASTPELYGDTDEVARQTAAAVVRDQPSELMVTPALLGTLLDLELIDPDTFSCLRYVKVGGSPLPEHIGRALTRRLPETRIVSLYGTTESARALLTTLWDERNTDLLGRGTDSTAVRVVDSEGKDLPAGEIGEICVRASGGSGKLEYFGDTEETAAVFQSAWVRTGDVGYLDEHQGVRLVGRNKEMLILPSGLKVNSFRIERMLGECPEVKEISVVGLEVPGKPYDNVAAAVVPRDPAIRPEEITAQYEVLADELVPRVTVLVDRLPRNGMDKVARAEVKSLFEQRGMGVYDLRAEVRS